MNLKGTGCMGVDRIQLCFKSRSSGL